MVVVIWLVSVATPDGLEMTAVAFRVVLLSESTVTPLDDHSEALMVSVVCVIRSFFHSYPDKARKSQSIT